MRRAYLCKGDQTTAGGTVIEGIENCTIHGKAQTFIGAAVYCPACKSEGVIVAAGPRLQDSIFGREAALSDDLCACRCAKWPRIIAAQGTDWQVIGGDADSSYAKSFSDLSSASLGLVHDEQFFLRDASSKRALAGVAYRVLVDDGVIAQGVTDSSGRTARIVTSSAEEITIEVEEAE